MRPPPPRDALAKADVVFEGRVTRVSTQTSFRQSSPKLSPGLPSFTNIEYQFEVLRVWKGPASPMLAIQTARASAACGRSFQLNERYLVYATRQPGSETLHDGLCSRTRLSSQANEDFAALETAITVATKPIKSLPQTDHTSATIPPEAPYIAPSPPPSSQHPPPGCTINHTPPTSPLLLLTLYILAPIAFKRTFTSHK